MHDEKRSSRIIRLQSIFDFSIHFLWQFYTNTSLANGLTHSLLLVAFFFTDFNLQAEATIPEDIFDQHDGDIVDDATSQLQYAEPTDDEADDSDAADIVSIGRVC